MRSVLACAALAGAALGAFAALGWSILVMGDALLYWNACRPVALDGVRERVAWSFCWSAVAAAATAAVARPAGRRAAGWFAVALVVVSLPAMGVLHLLASAEPPSDVATCDSTDAVRRVRALALLLPALAVGGTGITC